MTKIQYNSSFVMFMKGAEHLSLFLFVFSFVISLPFSQDDAILVQDHYTLLERQIIIEVRTWRKSEVWTFM